MRGSECAGFRAAEHDRTVLDAWFETLIDRCHPLAHVRWRNADIPERADPPSRAEHSRGLRSAHLGLHPVPGLRRRDQVKHPARWVPELKRRDLDLDALRARKLCHPLVDFDTQNLASASREQRRRDPGSAADVHSGSGPTDEERVDQLGRIRRTHAVIKLGDRTKRLRTRTIIERHAWDIRSACAPWSASAKAQGSLRRRWRRRRGSHVLGVRSVWFR